jgi:ATP-dependent Lhr-like helicase
LRSESPSATERRTALAHALLERYGVVTREVAETERIEGGFSAVYPVLKAMEEAGRVRRGYFVAGRGATQFAVPGADDRLRGERGKVHAPDAADAADASFAEDLGSAGEGHEDDAGRVFLLAATDPANPYGGALPWPEHPSGKGPQRGAGARVLLCEGRLLGWLAKKSDQLLTFVPDDDGGAIRTRLAEALAALGRRRTRSPLYFATIDGAPAAESSLAPALLAAGFVRRGGALGFRPDPEGRASPRPDATEIARSGASRRLARR